MKKNSQVFIKKNEIKIIAVLLLAIALLGFWSHSNRRPGQTAQIYQNGVLMMTLDLNMDGVYKIDEITIEVRNQSIAVVHSDCPDKICVKTGSISYVGQIIACVPNNLIIRITGESDIDAVATR